MYTWLFSFVPSRFIKLTDSFGAEKERGRERTCACNAGGDYGTQNSTQNAAAQSIEYTGPAGLIECILPMPDYIPAAPPNQLHSRPRDQSAAAQSVVLAFPPPLERGRLFHPLVGPTQRLERRRVAVVGNDDRDKDDEPIITRTGPIRFSSPDGESGETRGTRATCSALLLLLLLLLSFRYSSLGEGENCYCPPRCKITAPIKQRPSNLTAYRLLRSTLAPR